jgi:hypothetical protein
MSKRELFTVRNSEWIIRETTSGIYEFSTADGSKKISGLSAKQVTSANAVIAEAERHIREGR